MAERIMMALGNFRFEIATAAYNQYALKNSWRWPEQARIGREPALQYVGQDVSIIDLDGMMYPQFAGGLDVLQKLRSIAGTGKSQILVDGLGRIWGKWAIVEVGDTRTVFADNGQPRKIGFKIKLKAYGDDHATGNRQG
jgi:hypothetical protein